MRPGTKKPDGDIETTYDWPLNWEIPDFTSDLCKGLSTFHPDIFRLLTSLGSFHHPSPLDLMGPARWLHYPLPSRHLWLGQNLLRLHDARSRHLDFGHSNSPHCRTKSPTLYRCRYHLWPPKRRIWPHSRPVRTASRSKHSGSLPLSTTPRKIEPTFFRKILLFATSSSPKLAYYVNSATPTLISPPSSKRFAWPSTTNLNKAGRQGSLWSAPTCHVAAYNVLPGTRSKPKPVLAVKNSRKLWLTNWRIRPSGSWEAPNHTSPPPCFSPCSRLFVPLRSPYLLIETLHSTSSNTSATLACPSPARPLLSGKPKEWCPLPVCQCHLTPHPSTFSPMSCRHLLHPGGHALSSSPILLGTDRGLWSLWRPTPWPSSDQTPRRPSKRILPLFRVPSSRLVSPLVTGEQQTSSRWCRQYHQGGCNSVLLCGSAGPPQPRKLQAAHSHTTQRYGWRYPWCCGPPSGQPSSLLVRILPRNDL